MLSTFELPYNLSILEYIGSIVFDGIGNNLRKIPNYSLIKLFVK